MIQCWRLDHVGQTIVFSSRQQRLPEVVYCGDLLPDNDDLHALADSLNRPLTPGTLDQIVPLSLLPEEGRGFPGQPGLRLNDDAGRPALTQFTLTETEELESGIVFKCTDARSGLVLSLSLKFQTESRVLEVSSVLANNGDRDWLVSWLSVPVLPVGEEFTDIIEYAGRWTQEFNRQTVPISRGVHLRENRRGRSGHDHFPAMIFAETGAAYTKGHSCAVHFGFSGTHEMLLEELPDGRRQAQAGYGEMQRLCRGDSVTSGIAYWAFSSRGLNGLACDFQQHVRRHIVTYPQGAGARPVHYNCWEAVYFDHRVDELKDLASRAAALGAERFVLDDGWFGANGQGRDDDTTSLGDWFVDPRKYPDGLHPLVDHVEALGMRFGLWVEPEMVNLESALARKHPEWLIMPADAKQVAGRSQYVLNLTNPEVGEYLFERIDWLLSTHAIDYLKWDMNRDLTLAVDGEGFPLLIRQARALNALLERIRSNHPRVEIESCASGGGRIDYGTLRHTHRVWLSDSNDAHERWRMQNEAFVFLPPEIVGSHVGPRHCHTSGRRLSMPFRALVAMTGHMGFEMDLRELNAEETDKLTRYTQLYKDNRDWMHKGAQLRLDCAAPESLAQMIVSDRRDRFFLFAGTLDVPRNETTAPVRLSGLDPHARYRVRLLNADEINRSATRRYENPLSGPDGIVLSGTALMQSGIVPPFPFPDTIWLFEGQAEELT
ncbi:alpha-galactosidase [Hoeflea sp. TYP-13]|uniref:alpha-galactosidase n=1 Tax=Hoeflea sp. TYP-13 TaxID=3230023 RepID=UPI0034C5C518